MELEPLPISHAELLALCEDDQAKVVVLDRETQLAIEDAEALMIETERRAAELAEVSRACRVAETKYSYELILINLG